MFRKLAQRRSIVSRRFKPARPQQLSHQLQRDLGVNLDDGWSRDWTLWK